MSSQVRLRLLPSTRCLFDEPIQVKVAGLRSKQVVTMRARSTDEKGVVFSSSATYRADNSGEIDLNRDASSSGSYVGVEPMGLLWSMRPDVLHKRFQKTNSLNPHVVNFSVHEEEGQILAEATNERFLMGDGVSRVPVKEGNIRGVLFTPPGEGPFPALLDLYMFGGGLSEKRASLLASRGFLVLTVALYGHDDMPRNIKEVILKKHLTFLKKHKKLLLGLCCALSRNSEGVNRRNSGQTSANGLNFESGQPAYEMMETDPDWAPSLHLGHTDIKPTDTDRSLRRGYREQLKKNALQATETGLHQADEILERQDEVTHEATENPNQQQTDTQKAAENVGRPNTKDDTEGGRQEGQTECNLCVLRCAEMNRLLEENRELRRELDDLRISDGFFGDSNEKVKYYTGLPNLATFYGFV